MLLYGKCILIADFDNDVKTSFSKEFRDQKCTIGSVNQNLDLNLQIINSNADIILADIDFFDLTPANAESFFARNNHIPIITMSHTVDRELWLAMLEAGADDHLFKPLDIQEVGARINAVLRRCGHAQNHSQPLGYEIQTACHKTCTNLVYFEDWVVNPAKHEIKSSNGTPCHLTSGDFNLLTIFLKNAHKVLSRDDIMDALHGHEWSPFDRSIDNQISRLRKKIEEDPTNPKIIKTIRGAGYAFISDIEIRPKS